MFYKLLQAFHDSSGDAPDVDVDTFSRTGWLMHFTTYEDGLRGKYVDEDGLRFLSWSMALYQSPRTVYARNCVAGVITDDHDQVCVGGF